MQIESAEVIQIRYYDVVRGDPETTVPGASFADRRLAQSCADQVHGRVVERVLRLNDWKEAAGDEPAAPPPSPPPAEPPVPEAPFQIVQMRVPLLNGAEPDFARATGGTVGSERALDPHRATTVFILANRWSKPTAIFAEGSTEQACRTAIALRLRTDPYVPEVRPATWGPGQDQPPDTSRIHMLEGDVGAPPASTPTIAYQAPPAFIPATPPWRKQASPPAASRAPRVEGTVPDQPQNIPVYSQAELLEHADRIGMAATTCAVCGAVCVRGAQTELTEYVVRDLRVDDFSPGHLHPSDRCATIMRLRPRPGG